jgi:GPN-loop GTPase
MHLVDSFILTRPSLYISALLLSLRSMLQLDLPTLNVLTKIDNLSNFPSLPFNLDFYTEVHDLDYLLPYLNSELDGKDNKELKEEDRPEGKFAALNRAITSLVTDFGLVGFEPLCVEDKATMAALLAVADKACGHIFASTNSDTVWQVAVNSGAAGLDIRDVQERWIDRREEMDELEREAWKQEGDEWKGAVPDEGVPDAGDSNDNMDDVLEQWKGMMARGAESGVKVVRTSHEQSQK